MGRLSSWLTDISQACRLPVCHADRLEVGWNVGEDLGGAGLTGQRGVDEGFAAAEGAEDV